VHPRIFSQFARPDASIWSFVLVFSAAALVAVLIRLLWRRKLDGAFYADAVFLVVFFEVAAFVAWFAMTRLGGLPAYGAMMFVAFALALVLAARKAKREGVDPNVVLDLWVVIFLSGVVGSRAFFVLQHPDIYKDALGRFDLWQALQFWDGGLVYYGGFLGAVLAAFVFLRIRKVGALRILDLLSPYVALGIAVARFGCYLNGCCWGKIARGLPWAVCFPRFGLIDHGIVGVHERLGEVARGASFSAAVHPAQLYASVGALIVFIILNVWYARRRFNGQIFCLLLILYGLDRFVVAFFRFWDTANEAQLPFGLSMGQVVSVLLAAAGLVLYLFLRSRSHCEPKP